MKKVVVSINNIFKLIMALSLGLMASLIFLNVILRYVFNSGLIWSEEISRYLFLWMIVIGIVIGVKENSHFEVDIVTSMVPKKAQKILYVISNLIVLSISILIIIGSWKMSVLNIHSKTPVIGIPLVLIYGCGVLIGTLISIMVIRNIVLVILNKKDISIVSTDSNSEG